MQIDKLRVASWMLISALALTLVTPAHAGGKRIVKAMARSLYFPSGTSVAAPGQCDCAFAECLVGDRVISCGFSFFVDGEGPEFPRMFITDNTSFVDEGAEVCVTCGCNQETVDVTVRADATCMARSGKGAP